MANGDFKLTLNESVLNNHVEDIAKNLLNIIGEEGLAFLIENSPELTGRWKQSVKLTTVTKTNRVFKISLVGGTEVPYSKKIETVYTKFPAPFRKTQTFLGMKYNKSSLVDGVELS